MNAAKKKGTLPKKRAAKSFKLFEKLKLEASGKLNLSFAEDIVSGLTWNTEGCCIEIQQTYWRTSWSGNCVSAGACHTGNIKTIEDVKPFGKNFNVCRFG